MRVVLALLVVASAAIAAAPTEAAPGTTGMCSAGALAVRIVTPGGHAAGSTYYRLEFRNLGPQACTLRGYPGVSAVNRAGHLLGAPAGRNPQHPSRTVTLPHRGAAFAILRVTDVANFPAGGCGPTTASALRVYAPGATVAKQVSFAFPTCARPGDVVLHVEAVTGR